MSPATGFGPGTPAELGFAAPRTFSEARESSRDRWVLLGGVAAAFAFAIIAALNAAGLLDTPLRAGEAAGFGPVLDFSVLAILAATGPYGFVLAWHRYRLERIERQLPDFLRDVAEAGRFGRTLGEAIAATARGRYGPLSPEIRKVAAEIDWGVPVATALERMAERIPTPLVRKAVAILVRAHAAGGQYAEVLARVAHDTRSEALAHDRRRTATATYVVVVYVAFGVFLLTVYILAAVFLPQMISSSSSSTAAVFGGLGAGLPIATALGVALLVAVIVQALGDGIIAGVVYRGRLADGLPHLVVLLAVGWTVMRFVVPIPGGGG